jgi:hypothetical protein
MKASSNGSKNDGLESLLNFLARIIADLREPSDAMFRALLLGAGLESQPDAAQELDRWSGLLNLLHTNHTMVVAAATYEALTRCGVPAMIAKEAIALIAGASHDSYPMRSGQISTSIEVLHLGTLNNMSQARGEFDVLGGPGTVAASEPWLEVTPRQFPAGITRITVNALGLVGSTFPTMVLPSQLSTPGA